MLENLRFCLVTDINSTFSDYERFLHDVIEGGVSSIQLRAKSKSPTELYELALALKKFLSPYKIPLIINDHIDLALEIGAEGVHLGQSDDNPRIARERLGANKIIGLSVESEEELKIANQSPYLDYIAASAVFESVSKANLKKIWGLEGLAKLSQLSTHPVIAIGGIELSNVESVFRHGAYGIALISAIHGAIDPKQTAKNFFDKINAIKGAHHE